MIRSILAAAAVTFVACGGKENPSQKTAVSGPAQAPSTVAATSDGTGLTGAGSTFTNPIMQKWIQQYHTAKGVEINYQSIGSGGGIRQFTQQTVDFGGTDAPMTNEQMAKAPYPVLHFPTVMGAVAMTYNLPGFNGTIRFTPDVLADIFLGKITKWNDARLTAINPGEKLPSTDILVVHRSDGSGTTFIVTDYLSSVSEAWKNGPGKAAAVNWPVGLGGKGNEGVAGQVKQTPGAIGYVELAYATANKLPVAELRNKSGRFLKPSNAGATAAAAGVAKSLPASTDFRISIVNAPGPDAYPIASFTWLIVYQKMQDGAKGKELTDFIHWILTDGQKDADALEYAPLPPNMVQLELKQLATITYPGKM